MGDIAVETLGDDVTVVALTGEHDIHTASDLGSRLDRGMASGNVVLDLSRTAFVDSSILGVVVDAWRRSQDTQSGFAIALEGNGSVAVRRVLEVTGLGDALPVCQSRDDAVARAGGTG